MRLSDKIVNPEKRIAEDIRRGDQAAVRKLYDTWSGYLFTLCLRYISDRDAAEDIFQDSFIKIYSSIGSFEWKGDGALRAWMSRITVNECLQYLRKKKRTDFIEYKDNLPELTDDSEDMPTLEDIPQQVIFKMIRELPDGYRTIFNLTVFEGRPHKEIAKILGITESTSASQFHRARKMLARRLADWRKTQENG